MDTKNKTKNHRILNKYRKICGTDPIDHLCAKAKTLAKKHILFISSTYAGGGVAEILNSLVFLLNQIGIDTGWRILHGSEDFFTTTKKFHNALQGEKINLSQRKKNLYYETNERFASYTHIRHDLIVIHDPQPLPLIEFYEKKVPWIFRCHIDLSAPNKEIWEYLKKYIEKYDQMVVSKNEYQQNLMIPHSIIHPAIDPLTIKNRALTDKTIKKYLKKYHIPDDKPILAQISRFDKWKDPLGVIQIFERVRKHTNCSLVLLGSLATDDPEGHYLYKKVQKRVEKNKYKNDIRVVLTDSDILVNCIQRAATVVIQKSIREGFGLVVSEALYKGTPVVASKVGGIPLQVIDGFNGFLLDSNDHPGFTKKIILLLNDPALCKEFGHNGITHIKNNFLITRLLLDWLNLIEQYVLTKPQT